MDPQKEREFFLELLTKGLQHLIDRGRRFGDDLDGDIGIGKGMSATKLAIQADSIHALVDGHRVAKESYMAGAWVKDERSLCGRYVAVIRRYKAEIILPLLTVANANDGMEAARTGWLKRISAWFSPSRTEREIRENKAKFYWTPGALGDELNLVKKSLDEIIAEAESIINDAEGRKKI